jgi:hypothetical protein
VSDGAQLRLLLLLIIRCDDDDGDDDAPCGFTGCGDALCSAAASGSACWRRDGACTMLLCRQATHIASSRACVIRTGAS